MKLMKRGRLKIIVQTASSQVGQASLPAIVGISRSKKQNIQKMKGRLNNYFQTALSGICWDIPAGFSLGLNHKQLQRARMPTLRIDV
ncbi:hypothetical protein [Neisseria animaloris]|uniref:hypothetical protein n=1 Tax=Neisseria animaloris TaxID=326522 RepID=UPI0039E15D20